MVRMILFTIKCDVYIIWCFIVSPNITSPEEGQEVNITEGSDGSITCTATGYPPPTVVWQDNNGVSLDINGFAFSTGVGNVSSVSVDLSSTGIMRTATGTYTCSASNILGIVSRNINITVQCKLISYFVVLCGIVSFECVHVLTCYVKMINFNRCTAVVYKLQFLDRG